MGPWAASLRQLGAPYSVLRASGELLAAAGQLEHLCILGGSLVVESNAEARAASQGFWRWCTAHPPLRQLQIDLQPATAVSSSLLDGLLGARPALQVQYCADNVFVSGSSFPWAFRHRV